MLKFESGGSLLGGRSPWLVTGRIAQPVRSRRSQISTTTGASPPVLPNGNCLRVARREEPHVALLGVIAGSIDGSEIALWGCARARWFSGDVRHASTSASGPRGAASRCSPQGNSEKPGHPPGRLMGLHPIGDCPRRPEATRGSPQWGVAPSTVPVDDQASRCRPEASSLKQLHVLLGRRGGVANNHH